MAILHNAFDETVQLIRNGFVTIPLDTGTRGTGLEKFMYLNHSLIPRVEKWLTERSRKRARHLGVSIEEPLPQPAVVAAITDIYVSAMWYKNGMHLYRVDSSLMRALEDAEMPDILMEEVRLPFPSIGILFQGEDGSPTPIRIGNSLVQRVTLFQDSEMLFLSFEYTEDRDREIYWGASVGVPCESTLRWSQLFENAKEFYRADISRSSEITDQRMTENKMIFKFLLYLMCDNVDLLKDYSRHQALQGVKGPKRDRIEQEWKFKPTIYTVGSKFRAMKRPERPAGIDEQHWHLKYRIQVAGHWRNQPVGKGHAQRKRIFIEPFWKGPTMSEAIIKDHEVKLP